MRFLRVLKIGTFWLLGAFVILLLSDLANGIPAEAMVRVITGWFWFLSRNLQSFALDSDIIFSGLVASVFSILTLHLLARWFSKQIQLKWTTRSSVSVFGFIVLLFAASFLVPGVLAISRLMLSEPWVYNSRNSEGYSYRHQLSGLYMTLLDSEVSTEDLPAPYEIDSLIAESSFSGSLSFQNGFSNSGFLYPAAGLHPFDHEDLPLFISPEFLRSGKPVRQAVSSDSSIKYIGPQQLEKLLEQVATAHREAHEEQ